MPNNFFYQEGIIKHFKVNYSNINMSIQQVQLNQEVLTSPILMHTGKHPRFIRGKLKSRVITKLPY